jgi:hypothetical protein
VTRGADADRAPCADPFYRKPALRDAVAELMRAVLADLARGSGEPAINQSAFSLGWQRNGQETFVSRRPKTWLAPPSISQLGCLERYPAMATVRRVLSEDDELRGKIDTLAGPWFSMTCRGLEQLLYLEVLDPLVRKSAGYRWREDVYAELYCRLESALLAQSVHLVDYLPVLGLEMGLNSVALTDGLTLGRMTDLQLEHAIGRGAVPAEPIERFGAVRLSRLHQSALMLTHEHKVEYGHLAERPDRPPSWEPLAP